MSQIIKIQHPYLVRIFDYEVSDENLIFIMPFCQNGDLIDEIKRNPKPNLNDIERILFPIIDALHYLHVELKMTHRDIKPRNILLNSERFPMLVDIDSGKISQFSTKMQTVIGTLTYMAPEVRDAHLKGRGFSKINYFKADMFSVGITMLHYIDSAKFKSLPFFENQISQLNLEPQLLLLFIEDIQKERKLPMSIYLLLKEILKWDASERNDAIQIWEKFGDVIYEIIIIIRKSRKKSRSQ